MLIKCPECGQSISKEAEACPHCGKKSAKQIDPNVAGCLGCLGLIILIVIIAALWPSSPSPSTSAAESKANELEMQKSMAWVYAERFVKERLAAPSKADFGGVLEQNPQSHVNAGKNGYYTVRGWVDAQNAFGGTVRQDFMCVVLDHGEDIWTCEMLTLGDLHYVSPDFKSHIESESHKGRSAGK